MAGDTQRIHDREIRIIFYGNSQIVYQITSSQLIEIVDVIHAAMDIEQRLK